MRFLDDLGSARDLTFREEHLARPTRFSERSPYFQDYPDSANPARERYQDTRAIQHYLGHRSPVSTSRYTMLSDARFKNFWKD
jgi:integrase